MITLKTDNEYGIDFFCEGKKEIRVKNHSLYGSNETRNNLKMVEFNGFLIRGVEKIVVDSGDFVIFRFYNSFGEIIVEYIMNIYEKLVVKTTSLNTLEYNFVEKLERN